VNPANAGAFAVRNHAFSELGPSNSERTDPVYNTPQTDARAHEASAMNRQDKAGRPVLAATA
jgi:hypothetical protein